MCCLWWICLSCHISVCSPCKEWISLRFEIPIELYRINHKKKTDDQTTQLITQTQSPEVLSLALGQGDPVPPTQPISQHSRSYADVTKDKNV